MKHIALVFAVGFLVSGYSRRIRNHELQLQQQSWNGRPDPLPSALNPLGLGLFRFPGNVVISPPSVKTCLSMLASGATKGSVTETEMMAVLGNFTGMQVDSDIDVSNSVWIKGTLKEDYRHRIHKEFGAEAFPVADTNPEPINKWVKESTGGRVEKLFDELDPLTVMVLVNTAFFKGSWAKQFDAKETRTAVFHTFDGNSLPCNMMYQRDEEMIFTELDNAQAVRLPYASGGLSATIFLPRAEGLRALDDIVGLLAPDSWTRVDEVLKSARQHVELRMPRFKLESGGSLRETLEELGMLTSFKGEKYGAFLGVSKDPWVHLSQVMHVATIEVNEEGTAASAPTETVVVATSMPSTPVPVAIDRPFLFVISDSDGAILFLAKASSPSLSGIGAAR